MTVLSKKNIEKNKRKKVDFPQIRYYFIAEMGKALRETWKNRGLTAPPKPLVAIGDLKCDCISTKDDRANKTKLISTPECLSKEYVIERNLSFDQ